MLALLEETSDRSAEIADLVQADAGLTYRLLQDANRAVAPTGVTIGAVPAALQVLGRDTLRTGISDLLSTASIRGGGSPMRLFQHALMTSLIAGTLARVLETVDVSMARTAGVLHDIAAWIPGVGHDVEGRHALRAARLLHRAGLPDSIVRAVALHHGAIEALESEAVVELASVLVMADRIATLLAPLDPDDVHAAGADESVPERVKVLADLAHDRATREVADGLLILGILLGVPSLSLETLDRDFARVSVDRVPPELPPVGLAPATLHALQTIRQATNEPEAVRLLVRAVRDLPGVGSLILLLDEPGESMLEGHPTNRPFFLRLGEAARTTAGVDEFWKRVHGEGRAAIYDPQPPDQGLFSIFKATRLLAVPLQVAKKPVGLVIVPEPGPVLTPAAASTLGLVAGVFGEALESLQLGRRSFLVAERIAVDGLTGLLNRSHFFERLAAEVRAANRYRRPLSLVMLDVDRFKSWNDTYGHQVGDRMLRDVSKVIRDCARQGDLIGRYGGDEFIVALPGCNAEQAVTFAERVRSQVESLGSIMRESCYDFSLSVSVGVASTTTYPCEVDALVFRADHALYRAKEKGRNRVHADQH